MKILVIGSGEIGYNVAAIISEKIIQSNVILVSPNEFDDMIINEKESDKLLIDYLNQPIKETKNNTNNYNYNKYQWRHFKSKLKIK